jgi:hypothetical protein
MFGYGNGSHYAITFNGDHVVSLIMSNMCIM